MKIHERWKDFGPHKNLRCDQCHTGGISDWLADGHTGLLVPPADVAAMVKAMQRLLTDQPLAEQLGRRGADRVKRDFSHQAYLLGMKQQLEQLQ